MKRIEIYRSWAEKGILEQAILIGDTSIFVKHHMEIIDFYEAEKAKGNKHPVKATLWHFTLDEKMFYYIRSRMYEEF